MCGQSGVSRRSLHGQKGGVFTFAFSADGSMAAYSCGTQRPVRTTRHSGAIRMELIHPSRSPLWPNSGISIVGLYVRIWDTATGTKHQMLKTRGSVVRILSFSEDGKCLRTDYGLFVNSTAIGLAPIPQDIPLFRSALFIEGEWVIRDGKRFLLLPTDYQPHRPGSQAVTNNLIVLGHKSGGVTFIYFDFSPQTHPCFMITGGPITVVTILGPFGMEPLNRKMHAR